MDKKLPLLTRIEKGIAAHYDFIANNPTLPRFLINEIISNPERIDMFKDSISIVAEQIIGNIQQQLDVAAEKKVIFKIKAVVLLVYIISLSFFMFIMLPITESVLSSFYVSKVVLISLFKLVYINTFICCLIFI